MSRIQEVYAVLMIMCWFTAALICEISPIRSFVLILCMGVCVKVGRLTEIDWENEENDDQFHDTADTENEEEQSANFHG